MRFRDVKYLTTMGALVAVVLVMSATPLGYLRLNPAMVLTLLMVPVVVGAVMLGRLGGTILGTVFGLTSFATCFGSDPLGVLLLGVNPFYTFVMCVVTRALAGFFIGVLYDVLKKLGREHVWKYILAGLWGSLLNTVLFLGALVLLFGREDAVHTGVIPVMGTLIAVNGTIEAAACAVIGGAVIAALKRTVYKS